MLSDAFIKLCVNLQKKKFRQKHNLFIVEGEKSVTELLNSKYKVKYICIYNSLQNKYQNVSLNVLKIVNESEMKKITALNSPSPALALVEIPDQQNCLKSVNTIALDEIRVPGNLGTIIRIADWYGVTQIICTAGCTDFYSPKVIQASMGSFLRVNVIYVEDRLFFNKHNFETYAAVMTGVNIKSVEKPTKPFCLMIGNEANGLGKDWINNTDQKVSIKKHGNAESLNAGIATAVLLDYLID